MIAAFRPPHFWYGAIIPEGEEGQVMSENFYKAFLAIILIPYSLIFLMHLWNMFGPSIRSRRKPGAEQNK
jgi:hypothetical protein